ncbi:MAG: SprT family zinc-dependent metalloprotease [Akkermansiaceae bacterium]
MNLKEAFDLLQEEMGAHGLIDLGWEAKMDHARKRFGVCRMSSKEISLSRPLVELNPEDEVRDTILHEIAHALAWEIHKENCGHDARWKEICSRIGARPLASYDSEVIEPELPWVLYHTETGEIFATYQRKPSRDPDQIWWRGRKAETHGKLAYGLNPKIYLPGKITQFDRNVVREFQNQVLEAVHKVSSKWGIETKEAKGTFDERNLDLALRFTPKKADEGNPALREFNEHAGLFGLDSEDFKRAFISEGRVFRLVALKPGSPKYPVIGEDQNGTRYKFPRDVLANLT